MTFMKHTKITNRAGVMISCLAISFTAHADWEGNFSTIVTERSAPEVSGMIHMKKDKLKLDANRPAQATTIADLQLKKAWILLPAQKMLMETDFQQVEKTSLFCGSEGVDACLKKQGYKKVGNETVNSYPSTVYETEKTSPDGKKTKIKIWRPDQLKEVPAVKSVVTDLSSGSTVETTFTNIKIALQPDSLFTVPKGYQSMGSPQDLIKNLSKGLGGIKLPGSGK